MLHWARISPKSEMRGSSQLLALHGVSRTCSPHASRSKVRWSCSGIACDGARSCSRRPTRHTTTCRSSSTCCVGSVCQPSPGLRGSTSSGPRYSARSSFARRLHRRSESAERALPQRARTLRGATARGGPTYDRVSRRRTFAQRSDRAARAARPAARREPGAACDAHAWPSAGGGARDSRDGELAVRAGGPVAHRRASRPARRRRSAARGRAHLARDARSRSCLARRSQHLDRDGVQCAAGAATLGLSHETNRPAPPRLLPRRGARRIRSAGTHPACWCLHTDEEEP